jgi:archaeosine-15-forming tRNA-guanine transglycosylase
MLLDMIKQNIQKAFQKFQDNKNKEYVKMQKKINEIIGTLNKYQTETEITINREINELRAKIYNIKEEVSTLWKISEKIMKQKYKQNGRPFQRNRTTRRQISEHEDEIAIKRKIEELLVKQCKTCEKKMQELIDSIKRPNLRIMGNEEGEEVQAKGMCNIFNKIVTENLQI